MRLAIVLALAAALALGLWLALRADAPELNGAEPASARVEAAPATDDLVSASAAPAPEPVPEPDVERAAAEPAPSAPEPAPARAPLAPTEITLYGFLLPPAGRELPAESAISVTERLGGRQLARAGADGAYAIGGLAPGEYWLHAGGLHEGVAKRRVELDGAQTEVRLDLPLELPPQVLVKIVDGAGEPFARHGMLPIATLEPPGEWFDEVRGSFNNPFGAGQFYQGGFAGVELPAGYMGRVVLDVEPPVHVSLVHYHRVIETQRVAPGQHEVVFVVDPESPLVKGSELRFHFVDAATGERLEPTMVSLNGSGSRSIRPVDGEFHTAGIAPGRYELGGFVPGYALGFRRVLVEPVEVNDLGAIPLEPEVRIAGRVVDEHGEGVATSVMYSLYDDEAGRPVRHFVLMTARTDADGRFEIRGLSRAVHYLSVFDQDAPWGRAGRRVDLRAGSVEDVRLELAPGVPLVVRPSGEAVGEVRYRVLDAGGELVLVTRLWSESPQPIPLAPGAYTIEARAGEGAPVRHEVTLASEPVELALP